VRSGRRSAGAGSLALAFVVGLTALVGMAGAAHAATAYRYWAYYIAAGNSWQYSQRGPASEHPQDGEVQGWRFAIQADQSGELVPRTTPNFGALCASTPAQDGKIRVAIVLDFGVASDAPAGEHPPANVVTGCLRVTPGVTGLDVLNAAVGASKVRIGGSGLICGIDGYPSTECAPAVEIPKPSATQAKPAPTPTPTTKAPAVQTPSQRPAATAGTPTSTAATQVTAPQSSAGSTSGSPTLSSTPTLSAAIAPSSPTTLDALRTSSSHHVFPTGAVVGGVIVVALGVAAAVRAFGGRR